MSVNYRTSEGKTISFGDNGSYAMLLTSISSSGEDTLIEAKSYIDEKAATLALKEHNHVATNITDGTITFAAKSHTHSPADISGASLIRVYPDTPDVEMENGESFYYLNISDKKIYLRAKSDDTITQTEVGALS